MTLNSPTSLFHHRYLITSLKCFCASILPLLTDIICKEMNSHNVKWSSGTEVYCSSNVACRNWFLQLLCYERCGHCHASVFWYFSGCGVCPIFVGAELQPSPTCSLSLSPMSLLLAAEIMKPPRKLIGLTSLLNWKNFSRISLCICLTLRVKKNGVDFYKSANLVMALCGFTILFLLELTPLPPPPSGNEMTTVI